MLVFVVVAVSVVLRGVDGVPDGRPGGPNRGDFTEVVDPAFVGVEAVGVLVLVVDV